MNEESIVREAMKMSPERCLRALRSLEREKPVWVPNQGEDTILVSARFDDFNEVILSHWVPIEVAQRVVQAHIKEPIKVTHWEGQQEGAFFCYESINQSGRTE